MMKRRHYIAGLLALLAGVELSGCSKDQDAPSGCRPLGLTQDPLSYRLESTFPNYGRPSFDPAGSGQFAYLKRGSDAQHQLGLWRAPLASPRNEQQLLLSEDFQAQLHWGSKGWLTFNNVVGQVMKIKSTGDSLQQLTFGIAHRQPVWAPDGSTLVCELDGPRPQQYGLVLLDKTGRQTGAIGPKPYGYAQAWSRDGRQLAVTYWPSNGVYGLGVYDFVTQQLRMVVPIDISHSSAGMIYGADWLPDSRTIVWTSELGVFKVDTQTGETTQLRCGCDSRIYLHPSVSPDGQTILVERTDRELVDRGTTIRGTDNLWTMNIDGTNERRVEF